MTVGGCIFTQGHDTMVKIVDWNIGFTRQPWRELVEMDADVAL